MNFSNRHRQILKLLLDREDEITSGDIAAEIHVSTRTVHRELAELNKLLQDAYGLELHKKSGKGVMLQTSVDKLEALRQHLAEAEVVELSADERRILILCALLERTEPVKLFSVAHDFGITAATVSHDLDELEGEITHSGLALIRRRGYGVQIEGPEENKRGLISRLAQTRLDDSDLFGRLAGSQRHPVAARLLDMVGREHLMKVEEVLWKTGDAWLNELPDMDYVRLLIQISTAVARILRGHTVEPTEDSHEESKNPMLLGTVKQLSEALQFPISEAEADYFYKLLKPHRQADPYMLMPQNDLAYLEIVQRLIRYVEDQIQVPLTEDRALTEGLLNHMQPALQRIREGAHIRNPLLPQIKHDYRDLFSLIRAAVNENLTEIQVPDEEVGYLVMHFGASLERLKQFGRSVRAIVVCTSGIGSSRMLAMRLGKEFPQIDIVGQASWFEAARIPQEAYDLMISTVDLPLERGQYIKLSPLLTEAEVERLEHFLQASAFRSKPGRAEPLTARSHTLEDLRRLQIYLNEIVGLLSGFKVYRIQDSMPGLRETLQHICNLARREGVIGDAEAVVQLLLARERLGSQVIPETSIALFHTRSEEIRKPYVSLFRLSGDLALEQREAPQVRQLMLMLGPRELSKEALEVLSEISALLLVPELVVLLDSGTEQEIRQFLSAELAAFFENKTETGRTKP